MGVYINMEMPTSCSVCFVKDCAARAKNKYVMSSRGQKCPLVPVLPHGRLIDADKIPYKKIMLDDNDEFYYGVTQPYIDRMPAVIEAEEGEDG